MWVADSLVGFVRWCTTLLFVCLRVCFLVYVLIFDFGWGCSIRMIDAGCFADLGYLCWFWVRGFGLWVNSGYFPFFVCHAFSGSLRWGF